MHTEFAEGSPLSSLLFVIAAQLLAVHLRAHAHLGVFRPISRPDGSPGPPSHQHADDTTLHVRTRQDLHAAIESCVLPFYRASGSCLNAGKSVAMLLGESRGPAGIGPSDRREVCREGSVCQAFRDQAQHRPSAAAEETYTGTLGSVRQVANHRVSRQLTQIGMVHVAKQVLASKVTYYAIFIPMSEPHARELDSCLSGFVGGSSATLRPGRAAFALPWEQGGMRLTQVSGVGSPGVRVLLHQEDPGPWHRQRTCTSLCQGL